MLSCCHPCRLCLAGLREPVSLSQSGSLWIPPHSHHHSRPLFTYTGLSSLNVTKTKTKKRRTKGKFLWSWNENWSFEASIMLVYSYRLEYTRRRWNRNRFPSTSHQTLANFCKWLPGNWALYTKQLRITH